MIKGIIFDCDGVIFDSEPIFTKAAEIQFKQYGIDPNTDDFLEKTTGITVKKYIEIVKETFPDLKVPAEELVKDFYKLSDDMLMVDDLVPIDGFVEFVEKMHKKGLKLGVASSSPRYYVEHKLNLFKVNQYFDFIVAGDEISKSKPDPEIYLKAIKKMNIDPKELIAIEDAPNGIKAAKGAGLYTVGLKASVIKQNTSLADEEVYEYKDIKIIDKEK